MMKRTSFIEYGLYVEDVERAAQWYNRLFEFPILMEDGDRLRALQAGEQQVLLLFKRGASVDGVPMPTGFIPSHDGSGPVHIAFAMEPAEIPEWKRKLDEQGIAIESTVQWPEGGTSFYFRDCDGHLLELITPSQWGFRPWKAANE
jgi:catechol 2,3-dioxygenase-like lactoylglutathione lyase family enzyme